MLTNNELNVLRGRARLHGGLNKQDALLLIAEVEQQRPFVEAELMRVRSVEVLDPDEYSEGYRRWAR